MIACKILLHPSKYIYIVKNILYTQIFTTLNQDTNPNSHNRKI
ncbi:hypothetical protein ECH_0672 [Ehrlichia chaffeensis str. Arkansas]|uniref:Uncharacterized protein n=1 Tax=Ehrlichia chaffeensis (strain ATCC CRL-10679 / Arkansas) TaxID=205920 RepID=Q2GGF4_EHRCR|nr:hypothetical protein ECH_0672 [Ehrlichia chaffeensis str. Arkansas]AHX07188.1 hypothetical protein ECHOSC_0606 [Ehrlichia chaffeensis str. Osceola]